MSPSTSINKVLFMSISLIASISIHGSYFSWSIRTYTKTTSIKQDVIYHPCLKLILWLESILRLGESRMSRMEYYNKKLECIFNGISTIFVILYKSFKTQDFIRNNLWGVNILRSSCSFEDQREIHFHLF